MSGTSLKCWSTFYKREIAKPHLKLTLSSAQCIGLVWVSTFQSIAKVILRQSVHLTTLVPGQAWLSKSPVLTTVLSLVTDRNQNDRRDCLIINFHISMGPAAKLTTDCAMGPYDQTWGQIHWKVFIYITVTFTDQWLQLYYNYRTCRNVMITITITLEILSNNYWLLWNFRIKL